MRDDERNAAAALIDRREFLQRAGGAGIALSGFTTLIAACGGDGDGGGGEAGGGAGGGGGGGGLDTVRWISPRGTLEVMDDYNLWVPIEQGYFEELGIRAQLIAGAAEGEMQLIAQNQADMGYPSPGVLTAAIDGGVPVFSVWEQYPAQVFDFSLPANSPIDSVQQLAGKTIAAGFPGAEVIINPILVEVGVDPESVEIVDAGAQWNQAVAQGQADAGLAWEGLRAQLLGQGLKLKFLLGSEFSEGPSNVYAVRKADLDDENRRDIYTRFFQGVVMGFEFAKANPRAAAQITYRQFPALQESLEPQLALESMMQLASGYGAEARRGNGWGYHDPEAWQGYLDAIAELGQTEKRLTVEDVLTNDFVEPANSGADVEKARSDAEAFELDEDFAATKPPADLPL